MGNRQTVACFEWSDPEHEHLRLGLLAVLDDGALSIMVDDSHYNGELSPSEAHKLGQALALAGKPQTVTPATAGRAPRRPFGFMTLTVLAAEPSMRCDDTTVLVRVTEVESVSERPPTVPTAPAMGCDVTLRTGAKFYVRESLGDVAVAMNIETSGRPDE